MTTTAHKSQISVNLVSQDEFSNSFMGKFLLWALSIGRYIVVFTEFIVILSFLSRFKLDRDLTDLNEEIARYKAIVLSYGDLEASIKDIQARTKIVNDISKKIQPSDIFVLMKSSLPSDVRAKDINFSNNTVNIKAEALSTQGFALFINRLMTHELVDHIEVGAVSSDDQNQVITFNITAVLKEN